MSEDFSMNDYTAAVLGRADQTAQREAEKTAEALAAQEAALERSRQYILDLDMKEI